MQRYPAKCNNLDTLHFMESHTKTVAGRSCPDNVSAAQNEKAVSDYLTSKQLLSSGFA